MNKASPPALLVSALNQFRFCDADAGASELLDAERYGRGHINDTYAVRMRGPGGGVRRYIVQRINQDVFPDPEAMMGNIRRVTTELGRKILETGGDPERETLTLVLTRDGACFHQAREGSYWRAYEYIAGASTYEVATPRLAYSAARTFARFQRLLADFPASELVESIPDFHHTGRRFGAFAEALARDQQNRAFQASPEIDFVLARADRATVLVDLLNSGELPCRVTHNDTKLNNVMIDDATGAGICLVDLDTVMPGLSLYDFGDAVRSAATSAAEDEADLSRVSLDLEIFDSLVRGYLDAGRDFLTPKEIEFLPFSAILMTLECGLRFLTDHLGGDIYFRTERPNHNLDRCRTQLRMVRALERNIDQMTEIVNRHRARSVTS